MKTKILLEAKGTKGIFEDMKLQVEGTTVGIENLLLMAMEKSEPFYEVVKGAVAYYEMEKRRKAKGN